MFNKIKLSFEGFQNQTSHWQFLNVFFKPAVTRLFITWFALAPAVVKTFQHLPNPLTVTVGAITYKIPLELPFRWEILWFASLSYAIAFVLHLILCPGFIKRYPNYSSYTDRGHSPRWLVWELFRAWNAITESARQKLFDRLVDKHYAAAELTNLLPFAEPSVSQNGTEWAFKREDKIYVLRINEGFDSNKQRDLFWEILGRYGASWVKFRYAVWLLLTLSALLVLLVVVQNIYFVLEYMINNGI